LFLMSEQARIPKKMPFGKHKGTLIKDLPADYIAWYQKQADADPYILKAMKG